MHLTPQLCPDPERSSWRDPHYRQAGRGFQRPKEGPGVLLQGWRRSFASTSGPGVLVPSRPGSAQVITIFSLVEVVLQAESTALKYSAILKRPDTHGHLGPEKEEEEEESDGEPEDSSTS
ncbi:PREDICTED: uncharacterized protein LOC105518843 [Colobus angolensis palliatus]|uniref:uncharacterized protein LOC105518843 n=1 Tax=Colobus angolensis palliatus TaxID=336983 RepID=UPI0005F5026D|nr:PREDICTED: uncharacterized protein LOC105518843 [Colobus angolensis palliatus]